MGKSNDPESHVGERFGKLTILAFDHEDHFGRRIYKTRCDCGKEVLVAYTSMSTGHTTSCGCSRDDLYESVRNDKIGERYGKLTIIAFDHRDARKKLYYRCKCDCGNEKVIRLDILRSGAVQSCGCHNRAVHSKDPNRHNGETWGRLTVIGFDHTDSSYNFWVRAKCQCGNEIVVPYQSLKTGQTQSCGCLNREVHTKHGLSYDRIYRIWKGMIARCCNPEDNSYPNYGGRGITVCDQWKDPITGLFNFHEWSISHGYQDGLSIDRIDNDAGYSPANCRWADLNTQANNKSNNLYIAYRLSEDSIPQYLIYTIAEWARITNVDYFLLYHRIFSVNAISVNDTLERCYREGHEIPADVPLEMEIPNEVLEANHLDRFVESIHD